MTSNDVLLAELQRLRGEVNALRTDYQHSLSAPHGWVRHFVKDLETNPVTQYKVHLYGVIYWLINFPLVAALFFFAPNVWLKWGVFITLFYSIYSNFATDYGAMSAAMAAEGQPPLPEVPLEPPVDASARVAASGNPAEADLSAETAPGPGPVIPPAAID